jgi:hypothetical protein
LRQLILELAEYHQKTISAWARSINNHQKKHHCGAARDHSEISSIEEFQQRKSTLVHATEFHTIAIVVSAVLFSISWNVL